MQQVVGGTIYPSSPLPSCMGGGEKTVAAIGSMNRLRRYQDGLLGQKISPFCFATTTKLSYYFIIFSLISHWLLSLSLSLMKTALSKCPKKAPENINFPKVLATNTKDSSCLSFYLPCRRRGFDSWFIASADFSNLLKLRKLFCSSKKFLMLLLFVSI